MVTLTIMWMLKLIILLFSFGAISAQNISQHDLFFNSSSEITTEGHQLILKCSVDTKDRLYHMKIMRNSTQFCTYRLGMYPSCNRKNGAYLLRADRKYYSCDCFESKELSIWLTIKKTRKDDNGTWSCDTHISNQTLEVAVRYPPSIIKISLKPEDKNITDGSSVTLSCSVDSFPKSNITWSVNDELIEIKDQRQDLVIKNATCQGSGVYVAVCTARNGVGNSTMKEHTVNVDCPPRINPKQTLQTQMIASPGNSVTLTATVMAYPAPKFTWKHYLEDKTEKVISDYRMTTKSNKLTSSLQIANIQEYDYGNYIMYATNGMGSISVTFILKKADDNELGRGIGIGFIIALLVMGVIVASAFFIWKKLGGKGLNLIQIFRVQKNSPRRASSENTVTTTRKPSTTQTTAVKFNKTSDETYEGLDSTQPRGEETYEGLLPVKSAKKAYEEQEIYENQVVR